MDIEIEQKIKKMENLVNRIGLPNSRVIEMMNKLGFEKISSKRKGNTIMDRFK